MADEFFQSGVYGESCWINSTKNIFSLSSIHDPIGQYFACPSDFLDMKTSCSDDYNSCSDDSMVFQELPRNDHNLLMDSTIEILGINGNFSSSPSLSASPDWNQSLQEVLTNSSQNYQQENELKRNFSSISSEDNSSSNYPFNKAKNQDFNYYSDLLQTLFDSTDDPHDQEQPQKSLLANNNNNNPINYAPSSTNYHRQNLNDFVPSLPKSNIEEIGESKSSSITKNSTNEPTYKRQRIETPSPLPTFKVRKEKLGDRITALQQLVSPFGKTDTASVLQEAIDYINFLHDQVNVLRKPYVKNGSSTQHQQVGGGPQVKEQEGLLKQDLRSNGLCLVPISSTFPVATETTMDFWTPTFGGTFR